MVSLEIMNNKTMGSRAIANATGKHHYNVLIDCRRVFEALEINSLDFSSQYKSLDGRTLEEYLLPHRELMILLTGYSIPLRAKVLDRWKELEEGLQRIPQTYSEALILAGEQAKLAEERAIKIQEDKPYVDFAKQIEDTQQTISMNDYAKATKKFGRTNLMKKLRKIKILMEDNTPYQTYIDRGYFEVREYVYHVLGHPRVGFTTVITGKGQIWLNTRLFIL